MSRGARVVARYLLVFYRDPEGAGQPEAFLRTGPEPEAARARLHRKNRPQRVKDTTPAAVPPGRLGVVASRRIGSAPQRSRAKRRMRELYRRARVQLPGDVVLVARPGIGDASWPRLKAAYQVALERARRGRARPRTRRSR